MTIAQRPLLPAAALLASLFAASCGVEPLVFTSGSGGSTSSGSGGNMEVDVCAAGVVCTSSGVTCCGERTVVYCESGEEGVFSSCGEGESCDNDESTCTCIPGARRCSRLGEAQVCERGGGGPGWTLEACPGGCAGGRCITFDICSTPDVLSCSADGSTVLQCTATLLHAKVFDCKSNGFEKGCMPPEDGETPADPEDLCVNACGVKGVALAAELCTAVPDSSCAVYVCDESGALAPDHVECRVEGQPCTVNEECATCSCVSNSCKGVGSKHCPSASECP